MFAVLAFVPAIVLFDIVSHPVVVAAILGPLSMPRTRSEEIEPWDL